MSWALRYRRDTKLGEKFKQIALQTYEEQSVAEHVRDMCPNRDQIEVVEVSD